jgi:hypothetical protein
MSDASKQLRVVFATSKPDIRLIIIYKFISYLTWNTICFHYKAIPADSA